MTFGDPVPTTRTDLQRTNPKRPQKQRFLILHEPGLMGEYLAWVRRVFEHPNSDLMALEEGESLNEAFMRVDAIRSDSGHKRAFYDQTWAVIDSSKRPTPVEPPRSLKLVTVSPNFEAWLLGHFINPHGIADLPSELKRHIDGYEGSLRYKENSLFGRFETARENEVNGAASTLCDLVDAMRESQRRFRGLDLPLAF